MAALPPKVKQIALNEIAAEYKKGNGVSIGDIASRAWLKAESHIPRSWIHVVGREIMQREIKALMKQDLPMEATISLIGNVPEDIRPVLSKMPYWVALDEGPKAIWVPSLKCTPDQWRQVAKMKRRKAQQVMVAADQARDFANFLDAMGASCLGDLAQ